MKTILKVVRCNRHGFRLGIFLPRNIDASTANSVKILGLTSEPVFPGIESYRRYKSLIAPELGEFIRSNNLAHAARENLHLLKFELTVENGVHTYTYKGASAYTKISGANRCEKADGKEVHANEDAIGILWAE